MPQQFSLGRIRAGGHGREESGAGALGEDSLSTGGFIFNLENLRALLETGLGFHVFPVETQARHAPLPGSLWHPSRPHSKPL